MINNKFWGFGFAQFAIFGLIPLYYNTLMAWNIKFLLDSFKSPLPWMNREKNEEATAENIWNSDYFHN